MTAGISLKKIVLLTLFLAVFSYPQNYKYNVITERKAQSNRGADYVKTVDTWVGTWNKSSTINGLIICDAGANCRSRDKKTKSGCNAVIYNHSQAFFVSGEYPYPRAQVGRFTDEQYTPVYGFSYDYAECESSDIPKCYENPYYVSSANCESGKGLYMIATLAQIENYMAAKTSALYGKEDYATYKLLVPQPETDTLVTAYGECTIFGVGSGLIYEALICPIGFAGRWSSSSASIASSSSGYEYSSSSLAAISSSSSGYDYSSSSYVPSGYQSEYHTPDYKPPPKHELEDETMVDPDNAKLLFYIKSLTEQLQYDHTYAKMAKEQLTHLIRIVETANAERQNQLTDVAGHLFEHTNIMNDGNTRISSILAAQQEGNRLTDSTNSLLRNLIDSFSALDIELTLGDTTTAEIPTDPELGLFDTVGGILQNQGVDFTIDSYLKDSVFILNDNFNIPNGGNTYDLSFNTGVSGIKYTGSFSLTNVYGVNVAGYINGFILFAVSIMNLFSYMRAIQTGGRG